VTLEDQQNINLFGRLNTKRHDLEDKIRLTQVSRIFHEERACSMTY